jgi:hypothetical protein
VAAADHHRVPPLPLRELRGREGGGGRGRGETTAAAPYAREQEALRRRRHRDLPYRRRRTGENLSVSVRQCARVRFVRAPLF